MKIFCFICLLGLSPITFAGGIFGKLPDELSSQSRYVFYSHGYIVEGDNKTPEHPRWGVYDYPQILQELQLPDTFLISEHRAKNTDPFVHAKKLASQVKTLIDEGVAPENITLVGFSRGGFITAIASNYLKNKDLKFIIQAACTSGLAKRSEIKLFGHIRSIYETSDTVGSCHDVVQRDPQHISSFEEIAISTGKEHGAFYRPIDDWLIPTIKWFE